MIPQDILNALLLAAAVLVLFGIGEFLYHVLKVDVEITRKLAHFGTGALTLLFPVLVANHWLVLGLCISFALLLGGSLRFNFLPSINAIERKSVGSLAYPVAVYVCYLVFEYNNFQYYYFYVPMLILAISDPLAALFGKSWPKGKYTIGSNKKTMTGSGIFFVSALLICFFLIPFQSVGQIGLFMVCIGLVTTLVEAISNSGSDNLTIPVAALSTLIFMEYYW